MSKSRRMPIIKDKPRNCKRTSAYWRPIRRIWKHFIKNMYQKYDVRSDYEWNELDIPSPKTLINDYDYCDYWWDFRSSWHDEKDKIKFSRK